MEQTYATQRSLINNPERNLIMIGLNWPFLTNFMYLIKHSSILLGKDISAVWNESLATKAKTLRHHFMLNEKLFTKKYEEYEKIKQERNTARSVSRDDLPNHLVIFPLLILFFKEQTDCLYKIINVSIV